MGLYSTGTTDSCSNSNTPEGRGSPRLATAFVMHVLSRVGGAAAPLVGIANVAEILPCQQSELSSESSVESSN